MSLVPHKHKLTITISGTVASGKTTVALALGKHLAHRGFDHVRITDSDLGDNATVCECSTNAACFPELMNEIGNRTEIEIKTIQTH